MLRNPPLSLYVHLPWCARKCPYCDFNSYAAPGPVPEDDYIEALFADLDRELKRVGERRFETVFIGGGTPSLFRPEGIARLLRGVRRRASLAPDAEITLEANPGTVDTTRLKGFLNAGINRLSIGVQSFNDSMLRSLGRIHDGQEALRAVQLAREAGFTNFNLDLMFGLPGQGIEEALSDVQTAMALSPSHISFYHLTLEPNTIFYKHPPAVPDEESVWRAQERCQQALRAGGYLQYEVSAYARSGFQCRHNLNYWRFGDYVGIGAGAHGKITDADNDRLIRTAKVRRPEAYFESLRITAETGGGEVIARKDRPLEFLMNHLRLREGFPESAFPTRTGVPLDVLETTLSDCVRDGLLTRTDGVIRCSDRGWNFLDDVLSRFLV